MPIETVFRVRVDFTFPPEPPDVTGPDDEDEKDDHDAYEKWSKNKAAMEEAVMLPGRYLDSNEMCLGLAVVGVDPYIICETNLLFTAAHAEVAIKQAVRHHGGTVL
jgi:hypothetical protein